MVDLDSNSVGDSSRFRALADLEAMLQSLPDGRTDSDGVVDIEIEVAGVAPNALTAADIDL